MTDWRNVPGPYEPPYDDFDLPRREHDDTEDDRRADEERYEQKEI